MTDLTVFTVLRSGGVYEPRHVERLREQVEKHLPGVPFAALSDQHLHRATRVRLERASWSGWWAKMELFRPDLRGDILYFDLDTDIRGSLGEIASVGQLTVLRDPYADGSPRKGFERIGSGVMYLPEAARAEVWDAWNQDTFRVMSALRAKGLGDQAFLQTLWEGKAKRWQDLLPRQLLSYKAEVNPQWRAGAVATLPEGARVVYGHGRPRPWEIEWRLAA
jgi:hypothetical protein